MVDAVVDAVEMLVDAVGCCGGCCDMDAVDAVGCMTVVSLKQWCAVVPAMPAFLPRSLGGCLCFSQSVFARRWPNTTPRCPQVASRSPKLTPRCSKRALKSVVNKQTNVSTRWGNHMGGRLRIYLCGNNK